MFEMFERFDLADMTGQRLEPLERQLPPEWPEVWRELAASVFATCISAPGMRTGAAPDAPQLGQLAQLAMAIVLGIAQDFGGTQPYIPVGAMLAASSRARRAMDLRRSGASYKQAADATGLTASRIRKIEGEWRREQIARRQGRLPLD